MVAMWSCHLRFEERVTPRIEVLEDGRSMLLSKEMLGTAGRVFLVKRVSCVLRVLNWTKFVEPQSKIFRRSLLMEASIVDWEDLTWAWVGNSSNEYPAWSVLSSAKLWMGFEVEARRSLMCRRKRVGESTEPWGTPALIEKDFERAPSAVTCMER